MGWMGLSQPFKCEMAKISHTTHTTPNATSSRGSSHREKALEGMVPDPTRGYDTHEGPGP